MENYQILNDRIDELSHQYDHSALVEFLADLPDKGSRAWELNLTKLIERIPECSNDLYDIAVTPVHNHEDTDDYFIRFAAFFGYCTYLRRHRNVSVLENTLDEFNEFVDEPMYAHIRALFLQLRGHRDDLRDAVDEARRAANGVENHPGVEHNLALSITEALEQEAMDKTDQLIQEGMESVNQALQRSDYPRFYATHGRLLAIKGNYKKAREEIKKAIDKENPNKEDYAIRLGNYQQHLSNINIKESENILDDRITEAINQIQGVQEETEETISKLQIRTLQFLGFFATLLAVIITSVQIASAQPFTVASRLILVQIGGLVCAFSAFGVILPDRRGWQRYSVMFVSGFILIILSYIIPEII